MRFVIVESPYNADTPEGIRANLDYLRACMRDCLLRGEAPFASHGLYTQPGVLDDRHPEERAKGIDAGLEVGKRCDATIVYDDLGISTGMRYGIQAAERAGRPIETRSLGFWHLNVQREGWT